MDYRRAARRGDRRPPRGGARALDARPRVAGVGWRADALRGFEKTLGDTVLAYAAVLVLFAGAIAGGVVFSTIRTAYAERERELATLRVLGFTRGEAWRVLLGEVVVQVLASLPSAP